VERMGVVVTRLEVKLVRTLLGLLGWVWVREELAVDIMDDLFVNEGQLELSRGDAMEGIWVILVVAWQVVELMFETGLQAEWEMVAGAGQLLLFEANADEEVAVMVGVEDKLVEAVLEMEWLEGTLLREELAMLVVRLEDTLLGYTVCVVFEAACLRYFFSKVLILVSSFALSDFKSPFDCFRLEM
jgi:hypothetical protein